MRGALRWLPAAAIVVVALVGLLSSIYEVQPGYTALLLRGGKMVATDVSPGLHWKIPLVESVVHVDMRVRLSTSRAGGEAKSGGDNGLALGYSVAWKVIDARRFYEATGGGADVVDSRLAEAAGRALSPALGGPPLEFLQQRSDAVKKTVERALEPAAAKLGIAVLGFELGAAQLPEALRKTTAERMAAATQAKLAGAKETAAATVAQIRQSAVDEQESVRATAAREALKIRTASDTQAAGIYAEASRTAPDFFRFYHALESERRQLTSHTRVIVISADSPWFEALHRSSAKAP